MHLHLLCETQFHHILYQWIKIVYTRYEHNFRLFVSLFSFIKAHWIFFVFSLNVQVNWFSYGMNLILILMYSAQAIWSITTYWFESCMKWVGVDRRVYTYCLAAFWNTILFAYILTIHTYTLPFVDGMLCIMQGIIQMVILVIQQNIITLYRYIIHNGI